MDKGGANSLEHGFFKTRCAVAPAVPLRDRSWIRVDVGRYVSSGYSISYIHTVRYTVTYTVRLSLVTALGGGARVQVFERSICARENGPRSVYIYTDITVLLLLL